MSECILVVDDDREIVRAIAILLEKEGYQVLKAYDGMQALGAEGTSGDHGCHDAKTRRIICGIENTRAKKHSDHCAQCKE